MSESLKRAISIALTMKDDSDEMIAILEQLLLQAEDFEARIFALENPIP